MAIGVEKVKDSGYQGLVGAAKTPTDGTGRTLTAAAMFAMCAPGYGKKYGVDDEQMREVLARIAWKNHYNGARNPRAQFKQGSLDGDDLQRAADGRRARRVRLLGRGRRFGRGDHRAGRRRAQVHRQADLHQGAVARRRQLLGQRRPRLRLHDVPRDRGDRPRRVRAGRRHQPARADRDGRGARLLHARRAPHLRRPAVRRARQRVEGSARRHLRPQGRHAGEPRRRPEELRPPGRRVGPAHDVRGVAPAARRSAAKSARSAHRPRRSRSRTTSAATPARWCRSSRSSAASSGSGRQHPQRWAGRCRRSSSSAFSC